MKMESLHPDVEFILMCIVFIIFFPVFIFFFFLIEADYRKIITKLDSSECVSINNTSTTTGTHLTDNNVRKELF